MKKQRRRIKKYFIQRKFKCNFLTILTLLYGLCELCIIMFSMVVSDVECQAWGYKIRLIFG